MKDHAEVTVFEKAARLGGHSRTIQVDYEGNKIPVDTGFIVFNHKSYPLLTLKVIFLIHYQALKLLSKRIKYIKKSPPPKEEITK
ncbi:MAG TPA: DUF1365 family protein [Alphaproteobacteria bacterium]|nr:DUF1365 family protein [Alphaproteobacteria bacterium]